MFLKKCVAFFGSRHHISFYHLLRRTLQLPVFLLCRSKLALVCLLLTGCSFGLQAQKATWIWYPGDFEVWLGKKMQNRRTERTVFLPPFWKMDSHYVLMDFHKDFSLTAPEEVAVFVEGRYNIKLDGKGLEVMPNRI